MLEMTCNEIATLLNITPPLATNPICRGISIDTRTLERDNLFIALSGSQVDGHDFLSAAHEKGAAAALVMKTLSSPLPKLEVKDTIKALGQLAFAWRKQFNLPLIAVTGSNGKTTLKNMIAAILRTACRPNEVLATTGTLNNHLGLPLTLCQLNPTHRYAVIEMGMNHAGEIDYLTKLALPDIAVITNAAAAHLEGLRTVANIARAKAEIFHGLSKQGIAILNRDDDFYDYWHQEVAPHKKLTFGFHPKADVRADINDCSEKQQIILQTPLGQTRLHLPLLGKHNVMNALAATAATIAAGIELDEIKTGLEAIAPAPGRLQLHRLTNEINLIDDTYNANPFSLAAALNVLTHFAGKKILVLGDMKELGEEAVTLHHTAGENIREAGIHHLFTYGELSAHATAGFGEGAQHFNQQQLLLQALTPHLAQPTTILVKGSRSMKMEKIVTELMQKEISSVYCAE